MKLYPFTPLVFVFAAMLAGPLAHAGPNDPVVPAPLKDVGVDEHLDAQVPLDVPLRDQDGKPVVLRDLIGIQKPVILSFAYHTCPVLCSMVLNSLANGLRPLDVAIGKDFDVITLSIDPHESLERTQAKRANIISEYNRPGADVAWHFLVGDDVNIHRVADAVGFRYKYDADAHQFAHPAVLAVLKPGGRISRYLYGIDYSPRDLKLALLEAKDGKSQSTLERVVLYCYRYDPKDGKYTLMADRVMKIGGALTACVLGSFLGIFWMQERRRAHQEKGAKGTSEGASKGVTAGDGTGACDSVAPPQSGGANLAPPQSGGANLKTIV